MKAVICPKYGSPDVLQIVEREKPTPKDDEILVKIVATTVESGDARMRDARRGKVPFWPISQLAMGLRGPRNPVLGVALAGEVEAAGSAVTRFQPGDRVFGSSGMSSGTHAEYFCVKAEGDVDAIPANLSFQEAAAVPFGSESALALLRMAKIASGQDVLIYGASGAVGVWAVQIAKHFGATVTAVCSAGNHDLVRGLGADHLIDYKTEDFTQNGQTYDIIFDTVGKTKWRQVKGSLKPQGRYLLAVMDWVEAGHVLRSMFSRGKKVVSGVATGSAEDLGFIKGLLESGDLKPVIDRSYPFAEIAEAHRYVDTGRKRGSVVITLGNAE